MKEVHILLVEDNEGDILLTTEALADSKLPVRISVAKDGEKAIAFLYKRDEFAGAPDPDLILLDINLPKINGKEVLKTIKQDPDLRMIPVVMLTTSSADADLVESYRNYVNCYITKPIDLNEFVNVVKTIEDFWLNTVLLP